MIQLSEKMLIFVPSVKKYWQCRKTLLPFFSYQIGNQVCKIGMHSHGNTCDYRDNCSYPHHFYRWGYLRLDIQRDWFHLWTFAWWLGFLSEGYSLDYCDFLCLAGIGFVIWGYLFHLFCYGLLFPCKRSRRISRILRPPRTGITFMMRVERK